MKPVKSVIILNRMSEPKEVDEPSIFTDTKNETLDTGNIIISNQTSPIKMSSYDIVDLLDEDGEHIKYMCVDTYTETMTCVNPRIYKYEISLLSETKLLEGIILPNLKITKMPNITRSIYYYINQYMSEYCPQIRVESQNNGYNFESKWNWTYDDNEDNTPDLEERFSMDCPEMQWNTPTLREVLNDLMMIDDCIPVLRDGRLEYMDLTETGRDVSNNEYINYVTRSKSSEDYVSELQVKMENVTNSKTDNYVTRIEYVPFMTDSDQVALKDTNVYVKTKNPIYKLKSLYMMFPGKYTRTSGTTFDPYEVIQWYEFDLCSIPGLVCEYQEYITKPIDYLSDPPVQLNQFGQSQNWSVYYTRGDNKIKNFLNKTTVFLWITNSFLNALMNAIIIDRLPPDATTWEALSDDKYYKVMFKVEYETLEGCLFRASKSDDVEHDRIVIDNQTNSYVDSYAQGFLEYQKANRLGNEQLHINARIPLDERLIEIGDIFDDCVIYQCQYQFFKDHTEINAIATKNYILREYFTGVKSKIRSWAIVSGNEALTRHDLEKYYCEFSWRSYNILDDFNLEGGYFASPLQQYTAQPLRYVAIEYYSTRKPVIPDPYKNYLTYYATELIPRIIGNSLVFTFGHDDNYYLERSINVDEINLDNTSMDDAGTIDWAREVDVGGLPLKQYSYTDDLGEFDYAEPSYCSDIKVIPRDGVNTYVDPVDGGYINPGSDIRKRFEFYCFLRPRIITLNFFDINEDIRYVHFYNRFTHHKDSQEIPVYSTQFEFKSDTLDICFTKEWLKRQQAISTTDNDVSDFQILMFTKSLYNFRRPDVLPRNIVPSGYHYPVSISVANVNGSNLNTAITITILGQFNTEQDARSRADTWIKNRCFYLNDGGASTPNILMAFKDIPTGNISYPQDGDGKYNVAFTFYLNILRTRNKNIYDEENHYLIVGHI